MGDNQPDASKDTADDEPDNPAPLGHIVDDLESRQTWSEWAVDQLAEGRSAEEVADELVANGWEEDDAAEIAEMARKVTRSLRGVVTREQVAAENSARYRKAMALRWFTPILSVASLWRLLNSVVAVWQSRRKKRKV